MAEERDHRLPDTGRRQPLDIGWAIGVFVLASSIGHVVNDVADRERGRLHPAKRSRPIAAGRASVPLALLCAVVLAVRTAAGTAACGGRAGGAST
ncbi:UbiA family prenyltransferase [Streptomyces sp. NPDC059467]|uniref:UbiA family prenyltransferase n=1 Tax=Streptomyces sp. NPDC059467 TaxID=3346844 RepID=UPI0036833ADD